MERISIPERYLKPTHQGQSTETEEPTECPVCKGAGFVHPRDGIAILYDRVIPCTAPGCLIDTIHRGQPAPLRAQTFENFKEVPGTEKALKYAKELAYATGDFIWLLIYGAPGNGKTHLCNAIIKESRAKGVNTRMVLAADLFATLREGIKDNKSDTLLRQYKEVELLAIDDYGVEYGSDWEASRFDELMTARYGWCRPTILITNKQLADLPERIQSRFKDSKMSRAVWNAAGDYRGAK